MKRMLLAGLTLALLGCSQGFQVDKSGNSLFDDLYGPLTDEAVVMVVNEYGQPIANAEVMIGWSLDNPFAGNFFNTNKMGQFTPPKEWQQALPVTIQAPGYVRATFFGQLPGVAVLELNRQIPKQTVEVAGTTTGFGQLKKDGKIDFGMVLPMMSRRRFQAFEISDILSSQMDHMKVAGQKLAVPSNITFPKQKENYGFFPVTFNKPNYRLDMNKVGNYRMVAGHGQFPFKKVADALRGGKNVFDVLNTFTFLSAGVADVSAFASKVPADIPVDTISLLPGMTINAPSYQKSYTLLSVALHHDSGKLFPTDVKIIEPHGSRNLMVSPRHTSREMMAILGTKKVLPGNLVTLERQVSTVIKPVPTGIKSMTPHFLPMINKPVRSGDTLSVRAPVAPKGVAPIGTFAALEDVEIIESSEMYYEKKFRVWEFYAAGWTGEMKMPNFPTVLNTSRQVKRWEIYFLGDDSSQTVGIGPELLDKATHATRNATDY